MSPAQQTLHEAVPSPAQCPACGSREAVEELAVGVSEAAQHFVLQELDSRRHSALVDHIRSLWGGESCSLVRCTSCGCRFAVPFVGGDEAFYTLAYQRTGYPEEKWEYRQTLDVIRGLPTARRRLLEIGAGSGRFVAKVSPLMVRREDVVATEFSDYGIEELRRLGVTALKSDFRSLSRERCAGGFDIVCLFQVLEHLDDLGGAFRKLRELCNDGGLVVLSTPSDARIRFNEQNDALMDMPPNHLTLWCRAAFERLATRNGFRLVEHQYEPRSVLRDSLLFLKYRFLRAAQRRGSVPNAIGSLRNTRARKGLSALWVACSLSTHLRVLRGIWRLPSGESQLAVLVRDPRMPVDSEVRP